MGGMTPYEFERICFPVGLDELVNIPINHPFRYHREFVFVRCNTQERQHIWMTKSVPGYNLLAKHLRGSAPADQPTILARVCKLTFVILPMSLVE